MLNLIHDFKNHLTIFSLTSFDISFKLIQSSRHQKCGNGKEKSFKSWEEWIRDFDWKVNWQPADWIIRPFILHLSIYFSKFLHLYSRFIYSLFLHLYFQCIKLFKSGHKEEDYKRMNLGWHLETGNRLIYPFIFSWHFNFNIDVRTDLPINFCRYIYFCPVM